MKLKWHVWTWILHAITTSMSEDGMYLLQAPQNSSGILEQLTTGLGSVKFTPKSEEP